MTKEHELPWQPLSPLEVIALFSEADFPWWIAGGYAIELFLGRELRSHADIDVLLLRVDHTSAHTMLGEWDCWAVDPPGTLRPWRSGETLPASVHDIWCREDRTGPWRLQLMLDGGDHRTWRSRRSPLIIRPIAQLGCRDAHGIPFLAPEVQLFYKAKSPRPKDEIDFAAVTPLLDTSQKTWLRDAITNIYGAEHAWLKKIPSTAV